VENREYMRLFDVTERTGVRKHGTVRRCHRCQSELRDTIVHFGEKVCSSLLRSELAGVFPVWVLFVVFRIWGVISVRFTV
jgi:NAD-dependent SIR2 family protein deacetylase